MKIALDVMGGDRAPGAIVQGALLSVETGVLPPEQILLVGPPDRIQAELQALGKPLDLFSILPASQVVEMNESPVEALRRKKDSTILVAARAVREKQALAMVSAGHTGAAVSSAVYLWRTLPGVRRPGIAITFSGHMGRPVSIIDVGANVSCTPEDLLNYAFMAALLLQDAFGLERPRVGLMNIGAEDEKGNQLTKTTHALFRSSGLNFVGNIEGNDVFRGACDVVVCEGFVGNVILKFGEGISEHMLQVFLAELELAGLPPDRVRELVGRIRKNTDYSEYGGALLLGVDGTCVICHGHSGPKAIANALKLAATAVAKGMNDHISAAILHQGRRAGGPDLTAKA